MDPRRIATSAAKHHGVLLPDLLDREEVTARQRRLRVASGEWRRLDGGILVIAGVPETFEMLATAALARHPTAALSHQSALRIHGTETATSAVHLSVQAGGPTRAVGAVLHQTLLEERDIVVRKGFRVTTLERTLVDLGATMGQRDLQRCIEDHLVRGRTTFARLESTFLRLATRGRTGIARTRAVLAALDGEPPTESELEAMFNRLLVAQLSTADPAGHVRLDRRGVGSGRLLVSRRPGDRRARRPPVPRPSRRLRTRSPARSGRADRGDPDPPLHPPPDHRRARVGRAGPPFGSRRSIGIRAGCDVTRRIQHGCGVDQPLAVSISPWLRPRCRPRTR